MKNGKKIGRLLLGGLLLIALPACSTKAAFVAANSHGPAMLALEGQTPAQLPIEYEVRATTFGQYSYTVTDEKTKVAGLLPLKVRPARIVLDILFFAPALFFNIQGACDQYTFDMETGVTVCEYGGRQTPVKATRTPLE